MPFPSLPPSGDNISAITVHLPRAVRHHALVIRQWLEDHTDEMVAYTCTLATIETPSIEPELHEPLFAHLRDTYRQIGYEVTRIPGRRTAGYFYARPPAHQRTRVHQLLLGHSDTVWPPGTLTTMPVERQGNKLKGPGVYDMKAGLAQMYFALRALHELGLTPSVTPLVCINADEEIGSPDTTLVIRRLAKVVNRALVFEPSLGLSGKLKTRRKGAGSFTIEIFGRAAHAGLNPEQGVSAILELAHIVQELNALNDPEHGITVNVGLVDGGIRTNVIAPYSRAVVDVRVPTREVAQRIGAAIRGLKPHQEGITLRISGGWGRPPMEKTPCNEALWNLARACGEVLGLELEEATAGGTSDANTTSQFTATLDGLGAVGDGAHAHHEYVCIDRMPERAALAALLVLCPPIQASV